MSIKESEWITKLRAELTQSKMTHNFTLSRDELIELLGGQFNFARAPQSQLEDIRDILMDHAQPHLAVRMNDALKYIDLAFIVAEGEKNAEAE